MTSTTRRATASHITGAPRANFFILVIGVAQIALWLYCMWQQFQTTHDSIIGLLQGGTIISSQMSARDLLSTLQGSMGKYNAIATTVALVTQLVYMENVLPNSPTARKLWLARGITVGFFVLESTTDLWYSAATGSTIGGAFTWVFSFGNGGWLASLCYIAAMLYGSMFLGVRGFANIQRAVAHVF